MAAKTDLIEWVLQGVRAHGGSATIVQVASHIWRHYEAELRASGDLFYTWQYDMRWAAQALRDQGVLAAHNVAHRRRWELARP